MGARFVAAQLAAGADLEKALRLLCERFDGFYTLLVSTRDSFAVVRDAIACKPAVIAETPQWVAMASEYRPSPASRRRARPHLRARAGRGLRMAALTRGTMQTVDLAVDERPRSSTPPCTPRMRQSVAALAGAEPDGRHSIAVG